MESRPISEDNGPSAPPDGEPRSRPPFEAGPGRRLWHLAIAIAGWVVFVYWWIVVLGRVSPDHARFTGLFILITAVVVVAITAIWSIHNRLIFKRKGPRTHVREVEEDYDRDRLGRHLSFAASSEDLKTDPIVMIRLEHQGKTYRPSRAGARAEPLPFAIKNRVRSHESR